MFHVSPLLDYIYPVTNLKSKLNLEFYPGKVIYYYLRRAESPDHASKAGLGISRKQPRPDDGVYGNIQRRICLTFCFLFLLLVY